MSSRMSTVTARRPSSSPSDARPASPITTNPGHPGFANAVIDEAFNTFLIPQMFAQVAQDKMTAEDAARAMQSKYMQLYRKWRNQGLV